jgi:hypothetical protein
MSGNLSVTFLQRKAKDAGCYSGEIDGRFGPNTATGYVEILRRKIIQPTDNLVAEVRNAVIASRPHQDDLQALYGPLASIIKDDPKRIGGCIFTDGGKWQTENIKSFGLPLVGNVSLHRRAAGVYRVALADVELLFPDYKPTKAAGFCCRHKNWDPAQSLTTHASGFAVDIDLDIDGTWERKENIAETILMSLRMKFTERDDAELLIEAKRQAVEIIKAMEAWGLVWGGRWGGKKVDDMHFQYASV